MAKQWEAAWSERVGESKRLQEKVVSMQSLLDKTSASEQQERQGRLALEEKCGLLKQMSCQINELQLQCNAETESRVRCEVKVHQYNAPATFCQCSILLKVASGRVFSFIRR